MKAVAEKWQSMPTAPAAGEAYVSGPQIAYAINTYDDHVVMSDSGKLWSAPYTVNEDGTIELGDRAEVIATYEPIQESARERIVLLEAKAKNGSEWDVMLIQAGVSGNGVNYGADALRSATALYEGVKAYADHPTKEENAARPERSIRDLVGTFRNVKYESRQIDGQKIEGLTARFKVVPQWLREALLEAHGAGEPDFYGLSHNVIADWEWGTANGKRVKEVKRIIEVKSVDVVTDPAAGGRIERLVASNSNQGGISVDLTQEQLDELMAKAAERGAQHAIEQIRIAAETEASEAATARAAADAAAAATAAQADAERVPVAAGAGAGDGEGGGTDAATEALKEARALRAEIRRERLTSMVDKMLAEAKISQGGKDMIRERYVELIERRDPLDTELKAAITRQQELEASLIQESANPRGLGASRIHTGDGYHDKAIKGLQGWFAGSAIDGVQPVGSLKEAWCRWNQVESWNFDPMEMMDSFGGGYRSGKDHARLQESLTTASWAEIFADNLYIMMMKAYVASPYSDWTKFVSDFDNAPDFQTRHFARVGGYGDLNDVAEQGTYLSTTSPGDEEINFAITKRGYLDDVTFEMIIGDRLNKVRRLPQEMALAASRTLYKFVMAMITTDNATLDYDSTALYDSTHSNTGTTALSVSGLDAVSIAMRSQTRALATAEIVGPRNKPKYLIVPNELESRARRIVDPSDAYQYAVATPADTETVLDPQRFKNQGLEVVVNDYLTDATDWWVVADPTQMSTIVVSFLGGNRDPELFTQDQPNVGSMFTAEKVTFKVRHIYGANILDHRAFYRQVVSGS